MLYDVSYCILCIILMYILSLQNYIVTFILIFKLITKLIFYNLLIDFLFFKLFISFTRLYLGTWCFFLFDLYELSYIKAFLFWYICIKMFSSVLSINQATVIDDPKISIIHWPLIRDGSSEIYQAVSCVLIIRGSQLG